MKQIQGKRLFDSKNREFRKIEYSKNWDSTVIKLKTANQIALHNKYRKVDTMNCNMKERSLDLSPLVRVSENRCILKILFHILIVWIISIRSIIDSEADFEAF